ncbi:MAG: choline dehydrogenase, partial [Acidobacteriota bacterium]|nr:choline dehydrogenase [Acidobacteriota bacterium]
MVTTDKSGTPYEYVVVGSGAGGGTVAARLAEQGHRVLLLEAGGDPRTMQGADPASNGENRMPADYDVPAFHALASENEATSWDFFVRHYSDDALQQKDPKYREVVDGQRVDGVLYPRAATLGGCTAHNAMILVYPHNEDWREIEQLTGDSSWSPASMRRYFQKLEDCHHRPLMRWIHKLLRINLTRHGFSGWLRTEIEVPKAVVGDQKLKHFLYDTVVGEIEGIGGNIFQRLAARIKRLRWTFLGRGDPNDWRL